MQIISRGIENLDKALLGSTKVLLVCDASFPYLNIRDKIEHMGVPYVVFDKFMSNPLYEDVCKGVELFQMTNCDTILAVGGGSSMDVAKCIKLYCQMSKDKNYLEQEYRDTGVRLVAIPTTAGTGSESTRYAVIYYQGVKQSVTHESIIPTVAILEPKVLKTLPLYQKKCTMLDALCQGIESWWSVNSTEESKVYSRMAVEGIMQNWRDYVLMDSDEAAAQIMMAANYAGQAINITQTTAPHAFSYKLTSMYNLPHGHAVAICLPHIWEYMVGHTELCIDKRGKDYLSRTFMDIAYVMGCSDVIAAVERFRTIMKECQMNYPQSQRIVEDVELLTHSVNPIRLGNNPILLDTEIIKEIYKAILSDYL